MKIGDKIKLLRTKKNITQRIISEHLSVAVNTLSQYENNLRSPDYETLMKISDYFEVSIDYFIHDYVEDEDLEYLKYFVNRHFNIVIEAKYVMGLMWDCIDENKTDCEDFSQYRKRLQQLFVEYQDSIKRVDSFLLEIDIEDEMLELM